MTNTFFSSDLHYGHARVAEIRGFSSIEQHNEWLADTWLSQVLSRDTVYILGDVTGVDRDIDAAMGWLTALPGTKHLIWGNHDAGHPSRSHSIRAEAQYLEAFDSVAPYRVLRVEGKRVHMSHFPVVTGDGHDDRGEVRWTDYRLPSNLPHPVLHGHLHSEVRVHSHVHEDGHVSNQYHVGIDAHGEFVPLGEIAQWVRRLNGSAGTLSNTTQPEEELRRAA